MSTLSTTLRFLECQPAQEEVKKKEFTKEDIDQKFDISMTKHKGQVLLLDLAHIFSCGWMLDELSDRLLLMLNCFVID